MTNESVCVLPMTVYVAYSVRVCVWDANGMFLNPLVGLTVEKRTAQKYSRAISQGIKIKQKSPFSRSTFVAHIHHLIKYDDHAWKTPLGHWQNVHVCFHMATCIKLFPDKKKNKTKH